MCERTSLADCRIHANMKETADPEKIGPALGFDYFMVSSARPGVPRAMHVRFAGQVAPRFVLAFGKRARANAAA
jgi:hypothetical protein